MASPTSSHPSYRLSCAPPIPVRPPPRRFYVGAKRGSGHHLYLCSVLHACWRSRIEYEKKVPIPMDRKKRYDYVPPGPSPLATTYVHRHRRGGKETGKARLDKAKRKAATREAEDSLYLDNIDDVLPLSMSALSVHVSEEKRVNKLLKPRHPSINRISMAARIKKTSRAKFKERHAKRLELEETAINGPV